MLSRPHGYPLRRYQCRFLQNIRVLGLKGSEEKIDQKTDQLPGLMLRVIKLQFQSQFMRTIPRHQEQSQLSYTSQPDPASCHHALGFINIKPSWFSALPFQVFPHLGDAAGQAEAHPLCQNGFLCAANLPARSFAFNTRPTPGLRPKRSVGSSRRAGLPGFHPPYLLESASKPLFPIKDRKLPLAFCSVPHDFSFAVIQCCLASFVGFQRFPSDFVFGIKPVLSHCDFLSSVHTEAALACPVPGSLLTFAVVDQQVASVRPVVSSIYPSASDQGNFPDLPSSLIFQLWLTQL